MFLEHDEMKFAILYTLKKYVEPISMPDLSAILTWDKEVMGYFDLSIMLNELIEDGYVESKYYRDDRAFSLSPKGEDTNDFFFERVPKSIRNRIDDAVGKMKYDEQDPNAVITHVFPIGVKQYMTEIKMLDTNTPMLELRINMGSRIQAERAAKKLKEQMPEIYADLLKRISEE